MGKKKKKNLRQLRQSSKGQGIKLRRFPIGSKTWNHTGEMVLLDPLAHGHLAENEKHPETKL